MKAIVQRVYGGPDVLKLEEVERPEAGDGEVLVRIRATSFNHADWVYVSGTPLIARAAFGMRAPKSLIRGKDVAGVVEEVGSGVTTLERGDEVYGELESGAFAEYVAAPAALLARKPTTLSFEEAGCVPLAGMTALLGIRDAASVKPGDRVLINGASGGVGSFAVQVAKALGAEVTAVASSRNAGLVRTLGADHVINYRSDDFTQAGTRYDVIFDLIGNHRLNRLRAALEPRGTLVLSSGTGNRVFGPTGRIVKATLMAPFVRQSIRLFSQNGSTQTLNELSALIDAGHIEPAIDRSYSLAHVSDAARHFADEHASGKIAISL